MLFLSSLVLVHRLLNLSDLVPEAFNGFLEGDNFVGVIRYDQGVILSFLALTHRRIHGGDGPFLFDFFKKGVNLFVFFLYGVIQGCYRG